MNRFFTLLLAASCLTAVGQVTYPYNPDGNADGDIAVGDLQDFLVTYGNPFSPSEIMVGDSSLTYWVEQLSQTVQEQQEMIDLLKGGDSRSLEYPDGLSGLVPVQHQFQQEGDYLVPADKNLYIKNYRAGYYEGDLLVDDYLLFPSNDDQPKVLATPLILKANSLVSSTSSSEFPQSIIGFLVDKRVEPVVVNIREESFTVPVGKYFVLRNTVVSDNSYSKLYVNDIQISSGCCVQWSHPDGMVLDAGDVLSPEAFMNGSQFNLYGYLVEEDYFDTPLQELQDENTEFVNMDIDSHPDGSVVFVNENTDVLFIDHDSNGGVVRRGLVLPSGSTEKKLRVMVTSLNGYTYFPLFESQSFTTYEDSNGFWEFQHKDEADRFFVLIRAENGRWYLSYGS